VTRKLDAGDYSLVGLEGIVSLERKSIADLVHTVISDWLRFRKELYRLAGHDLAAIVVEANLEDVLAHRYESEANPESVLGRVNSIYCDHGIPVLFWGPRATAVHMAEKFLLMAWKRYGGQP
jgi:ERCC4-type nuclease